MVRKLLERIAAPIRGLHQAAYLLAALTLASQALALLRDRTFAHAFGAGATLDLYYAAFRVPDLVFALISSLVSAYVLIPRLTGADPTAARRLISESSTFLITLGGTLCAVLAFFMPQALSFLYPNLSASPLAENFVLLARMLLLQPILLGLSGVFASVTQVYKRFVLFAISPVLYNLGIIFGAQVLYPALGLPGIGLGVLMGALAYLLVHVLVVWGSGLAPRLSLPTRALMLPVMRDSVPRSLALGVGSLTALVLVALASRTGTGAVSVFTFASNLEAVPLSLIGASYAVAAFPALAAASAPGRREEFSGILLASARHVILWSFVALGLIVVLRAYLVRAILGTGAFDWNATKLTAALLAILAVGLVAQGLALLFSRALYAARQSWRPLAYQLAAFAITALLALFFLAHPDTVFLDAVSRLMKVQGVPGTEVMLLALASTVGQIFLVALSLLALKSESPGLARSLARPLFDGAAAALAAGTVAYAVLAFLGNLGPLTTLAAVFSHGLAAGMAGLFAAAAALYALENQEFRTVWSALSRFATREPIQSAALAPAAEEAPHP